MDMDLLRRWLELDERKRQLKADLKLVETSLTKLEEAALEELSTNSIQNISIDGRTVYIACDRWPKVKDKTALVKVMRENGLGDLVGVNTNTLRGVMTEWYRAYEADLTDDQRVASNANDAIPEAFREVLEYSETYSVKSCKS